MYLQSIQSAVPPHAFTQPECWSILEESEILNTLTTRSKQLLRKVLLGDSGIEKRHFSTKDPSTLFSSSAESLHRNFAEAAPRLAAESLRKALEAADMRADQLDALFICTCTGYLCPGLTSYVAEELGLPATTFLQDIVGLGCGAALPMLRSANGFLAAQPNATVACIAVEVCSAAFYFDNDPGVLISDCLFGDGAAATIWSNKPERTGYRIHSFDTIHKPEDRELLRFTNAEGKLRNQLHKSLPEVAAKAVHTLYDRANLDNTTEVISHVGGRSVLDALEAELPIPPLTQSRKTLRDYGNLSSPSVLLTLQDTLEGNQPPKKLWLTAFGAGFAAHSAQLSSE